MSDPSKNLILNLLSGLLLATTQPNVADTHRRIDELAQEQTQNNSNAFSSAVNDVPSDNIGSGIQQQDIELPTRGTLNDGVHDSNLRLDIICTAANVVNVLIHPKNDDGNVVNRATDDLNNPDQVIIPVLPPKDEFVDAMPNEGIDDDVMDCPDSDVKYVCHDIRQCTSWVTDTYKSKDNGKKVFKKCLGASFCNEFHCGFVACPKFTRKTGTTPTKNCCEVHPIAELSYLPYSVQLVLTLFPEHRCIEIENCGNHNHPRPPQTKPSPRSYDRLELMVNTTNKASPLTLSIGTETRQPVGMIDSAFKNLDCIRH